MRSCSCQGTTLAEYRAMALLLKDQIGIASTFGKAVGIVFRATHPEEQTRPADFSERPKSCQECTPHIGRVFVEENLRTQEEYDAWYEQRSAIFEKCGKKCSRAEACANGFDMFTPLGSCPS